MMFARVVIDVVNGGGANEPVPQAVLNELELLDRDQTATPPLGDADSDVAANCEVESIMNRVTPNTKCTPIKLVREFLSHSKWLQSPTHWGVIPYTISLVNYRLEIVQEQGVSHRFGLKLPFDFNMHAGEERMCKIHTGIICPTDAKGIKFEQHAELDIIPGGYDIPFVQTMFVDKRRCQLPLQLKLINNNIQRVTITRLKPVVMCTFIYDQKSAITFTNLHPEQNTITSLDENSPFCPHIGRSIIERPGWQTEPIQASKHS